MLSALVNPTGLFAGLVWGALFLLSAPIQAQEIEFGRFGNYTISLENISLGDLTFENPVLSNGGIYQVELIDSYVLSIIGIKYLDVGVELIGDGELLLDGDPANSGDPQRSIPFTLRAAYANNGENNISDAVFIPVAGGNVGNARFPILTRQSQPPGPPPTPPTGEFDQSLVEESAYLYLYGEIDVGNVVAGFYSGTINITVEYQ
jgi:hypothetical protein